VPVPSDAVIYIGKAVAGAGADAVPCCYIGKAGAGASRHRVRKTGPQNSRAGALLPRYWLKFTNYDRNMYFAYFSKQNFCRRGKYFKILSKK
jgi:hypothetical protein